MGLIDEARDDLRVLVDPENYSAVDAILAPLAEVVECVEMIATLCPRGRLGALILSQSSDGAWRVTIRATTRSFQHITLHAALRAAVRSMENKND